MALRNLQGDVIFAKERKRNSRHLSINLCVIKSVISSVKKNDSRNYISREINRRCDFLDDTAAMTYVGIENCCDNSVICTVESGKYDKLQISNTANYIVNNRNRSSPCFNHLTTVTQTKDDHERYHIAQPHKQHYVHG